MRNLFLLTCAAACAQAASITFDHIDFVTYQWTESQNTANAGGNTRDPVTYLFNQTIPTTQSPTDFHMPPGTNPAMDGLLGFNTSVTALVLGAQDSISNGNLSNNRNTQGGEQVDFIRGVITVKALFDVHGTPGVPINVYLHDALHGIFDTNTSTQNAGSADLITTFQTPQEQGYYQHSMTNTPAVGISGSWLWDSSYSPGDKTHPDQPGHLNSITSPSHGFTSLNPLESVVNYSSGLFYDGTYFDGGTVGVTATLDVWINSNGMNFISSNNFYNTLQVDLIAQDAPVTTPEPSSLGMGASGALLVGLGALRRTRRR